MVTVLDARLTHYRPGGIARYMTQLATTLPALDPEQAYAVLQMWKQTAELGLPGNARRVNVYTPAHHRLERLALAGEIAVHTRGRAALVHSMDFIPPVSFGWRTVITIHDLTFLHYPQFLTRAARRYYNGQIRVAVRQADLILADSHATRADIHALLGVDASKTRTVHLGVDARFQPPGADTVRAFTARYGLRRGYLLFVGTFEPRKNVATLIQAYAELRKTLPAAPVLVLAGARGWLYEETLALVDKHHLTEHVRWLENVPDIDLPALYAAAQALILPSHYEGFGLPVLEAMACGTPTIIAERASLPEIGGDAALMIDPDDPATLTRALRRVLTDDSLHATLAQRGLVRARHFTWQRCAVETLAAYRTLRG